MADDVLPVSSIGSSSSISCVTPSTACPPPVQDHNQTGTSPDSKRTFPLFLESARSWNGLPHNQCMTCDRAQRNKQKASQCRRETYQQCLHKWQVHHPSWDWYDIHADIRHSGIPQPAVCIEEIPLSTSAAIHHYAWHC